MAEAVTADGQLAVLKIALPPGIDGFAPFEQELQALQDAGGDPYARLICHDEERRSILLERLGRPLGSLGWPADRQIAAITATVARGWRPASSGLPTGAARPEAVALSPTRGGPRRACTDGRQAGDRLCRRASVP